MEPKKQQKNRVKRPDLAWNTCWVFGFLADSLTVKLKHDMATPRPTKFIPTQKKDTTKTYKKTTVLGPGSPWAAAHCTVAYHRCLTWCTFGAVALKKASKGIQLQHEIWPRPQLVNGVLFPTPHINNICSWLLWVCGCFRFTTGWDIPRGSQRQNQPKGHQHCADTVALNIAMMPARNTFPRHGKKWGCSYHSKWHKKRATADFEGNQADRSCSAKAETRTAW